MEFKLHFRCINRRKKNLFEYYEIIIKELFFKKKFKHVFIEYAS